MKMTMLPLLALMAVSAPAAENQLSTDAKMTYGLAKDNVLKAAQKMPEENYGFAPTEEVRTFARLVGHIADANNNFCAAVKGESNPNPGVEKSKTTKEDLVKALSDAIAYCNGVYNSMTDDEAAKTIKFFGRDMSKISVLQFNTAHTFEHYGNIVTYMRIKKLVPPSSEGR